jgi:hypothetical protein
LDILIFDRNILKDIEALEADPKRSAVNSLPGWSGLCSFQGSSAPNDTRNEIRFGFLCLESSPFVCHVYEEFLLLPGQSSELFFQLSSRFLTV